MFNILIVEDDKNIQKLMTEVLITDGYKVTSAFNGIEALDVLEQKQIDLIILDIMMPKMNGFEFAKTLKNNNAFIPILVITARHLLEDKKKAFTLGVDDYMIKPVEEEEMLLRIKALLRRSNNTSEHTLKIGNITLNYNELSIKTNKENIYLPKKEFYILYKLLTNPNTIYTRFQLMEEFWGYDTESETHTVSVHINRIRSKIDYIEEFKILTIHGLGYKAVIYEK
ncbi:response regulator transcription factor [Haploplasma axanthum]|uniref:Heme response regulator HssR n=1 Tax=Haploplasma axanthum TaxID=29552 RepID=A0A449BBL8_HAPAX|nr:response regulator transcription factor [Haploplasma axanthum]VEU79835.1 Heme response regulator hssR [Haploplasma axanthum]